jgi:hypothetical protein
VLSDEFGQQKKRGMVELTSFSMVDCILPRPTAVAAIVDAV